MASNFEMQSSLLESDSSAFVPNMASVKGKPRRQPWPTAAWIILFQQNEGSEQTLPWELDAEITAAEAEAIGRSLQAWQLGETSDGRHLRVAAQRYAQRSGDVDFPAAAELFIREEQRHGEMLGRFLDRAGIGRIQSNWGDHLFRFARHWLTNMETWTTPVLMIETLAMVYYNAIRRATGSRLLQALCRQILRDEVPHIRFQSERLALLLRDRSHPGFWLTMCLHRLGFLVVLLLVWLGHRRALRAGGYDWRHYWRAAWDRMNSAWRQMDPGSYIWDDADDSLVTRTAR